jgi:hypothetical protein
MWLVTAGLRRSVETSRPDGVRTRPDAPEQRSDVVASVGMQRSGNSSKPKQRSPPATWSEASTLSRTADPTFVDLA